MDVSNNSIHQGVFIECVDDIIKQGFLSHGLILRITMGKVSVSRLGDKVSMHCDNINYPNLYILFMVFLAK
jgi:hypothetical protein